MWDNPSPYSKAALRESIARLSGENGRIHLRLTTLERIVREQDQIIQALTDELGYVIERVPDHWAIVEKEEDYE